MVPHPSLVRAPGACGVPITWQKARELARGFREQIILEGKEGENEDMTVDAREGEREVPE